MVKAHIAPAGGDMTIVAGVGRRNVVGRLTRSRAAIMTDRAGPRYRPVVKAHGAPFSGDVAIITCVGRWNVVGRLARGDAAIVAS